MSSSLDYLSQHAEEALEPEVIPLSVEMLGLGRGDDNVWDKIYTRHRMVIREDRLIAANQDLLDVLLRELDALVAEALQ